MKSDELLQKITQQLQSDEIDKDNLTADLEALINLYHKQDRQLDRLTKLSDNTQAKLSKTNAKLEKLLRNLSRFVPDAVVDLLMREGGEQLPKNSREKITVFFSDIVGFTGITERLEPERLAPLMTEYFTEMTKICSKWKAHWINLLVMPLLSSLVRPHPKVLSKMQFKPLAWHLICNNDSQLCVQNGPQKV